MEERKSVLLVEDDPNFGLILRDYLTIKGYDVTLARDGIHGLNDFKSKDYNICILDVMMP
ncbi:MAG: response regulator, partial [Cryomorphaceae bacterium]|nr:response regulator [Cryomorphaceae bacterium]